jgi:hypothetical protein
MIDAGTDVSNGSARVSPPTSAPELDELHRSLDDSGHTLEGERLLEERAFLLRDRWLLHARSHVNGMMRSPPLQGRYTLPRGSGLDHSYERNLSCGELEQRLAAYRVVPEGWRAAHVVFASGMSALATFYQAYLAMIRPHADRPLQLAKFGAYFETRLLFEILKSDVFRWRAVEAHGLAATLRELSADVLHVEPVRYDWDLTPIDLRELRTALSAHRLSAVVLDTTLTGDEFPVEALLEDATISPPGLVIQAVSGLKLHQLGLELANVGLLTVYVSEQRGGSLVAEQVADYLRRTRTIVGSAPSLGDTAVLDAPFFLDPALTRDYARRVFASNAALAASLARGGLWRRVVHPREDGSEGWAQSPFIVFHLVEDSLENHGLLLSVLHHEAQARGLSFVMGSSFGFRTHRFECIVPNKAAGKGLFKVAMGARRGPSWSGVRDLLNEVGAYGSFEELQKAYPDVRALDVRGAAD